MIANLSKQYAKVAILPSTAVSRQASRLRHISQGPPTLSRKADLTCRSDSTRFDSMRCCLPRVLGSPLQTASFSSKSSPPVDPALATIKKVLSKSEPCLSEHSLPGNFNGAVLVETLDGELGDIPECTHFVLAFLSSQRKLSERLMLFSTEAGNERLFGGKVGEIEAAYDQAVRTAPPDSKHLLNRDELGVYMASVARALEAAAHAQERPASRASCILETALHAMALLVERKAENGVVYWVATFYDPNDTAKCKEVMALSPEGLERWGLLDMMPSPERARNYGSEVQLPLAAVCLNSDLQLSVPPTGAGHSAEHMYVALSSGVSNALDSIFCVAGPVPHEVLLAWCDTDNAPGLYVAFQNGYAKTVEVYTRYVLSSKHLSKPDKLKLLAARCGDGRPGLDIARYMGQVDTIRAFNEQILKAGNLSESEKRTLLTAEYNPIGRG